MYGSVKGGKIILFPSRSRTSPPAPTSSPSPLPKAPPRRNSSCNSKGQEVYLNPDALFTLCNHLYWLTRMARITICLIRVIRVLKATSNNYPNNTLLGNDNSCFTSYINMNYRVMAINSWQLMIIHVLPLILTWITV